MKNKVKEETYKQELLIKVTWFYYVNKMTQQKIAELLGISRMKVVRLLDKAEQEGIIQFKINSKLFTNMKVSDSLKQRYNLKDIYVVPSVANATQDEINDSVAVGAANYLSDRLPKNCFINLGYGSTPIKTACNITKATKEKLNFVSLTGGVSIYLLNTHSNITKGNLYLIPAPLIATNKELVDALEKEQTVKEILAMQKAAEYTILGIGGVNNNATLSQNNLISSNSLSILETKGVVGDILSHFIDIDGNVIENEFESLLVSSSLEKINDFKNVVAVSAGVHKLLAIRAALRRGLIDILVTDEDTMNWLNENE